MSSGSLRNTVLCAGRSTSFRIHGVLQCTVTCCSGALSDTRQVTDLTRPQWRGSNQSGWRLFWTGTETSILYHTHKKETCSSLKEHRSQANECSHLSLTPFPKPLTSPSPTNITCPCPRQHWRGKRNRRQPRGLQPHSDVPSAVKVKHTPEVRRRTTRGDRQTGEGGTSARSEGVKEH